MEESGQTRAARILPDFSDYEEAKALGILDEMLEGKKSIVILGHVNPDGDCIGSCLGLYNYLKENYEGLEVSVYLEKMGVKFSFLSGFEDVHTEYDDTKTFDLCITSDASDVPRLGVFAPYRETAKDTFCVDHHQTAPHLRFQTCDYVRPRRYHWKRLPEFKLDAEKNDRGNKFRKCFRYTCRCIKGR